MTTSIILQTNNENDNTFGDSHFSIILPYTKDHLWAMQLNSFNFRPMFNIYYTTIYERPFMGYAIKLF